MTDIGKGDVVAAVASMSISGMWTASGRSYSVKAGQRAIVAEVVKAGGVCTACGAPPDLTGLLLEEYPLKQGVLFCPCEWRKVGGGEEEHVAQFAHHLKPAKARPRVRERA